MRTRGKRNVVIHHEPTEEWLRLRNPQTKKEILSWYKRETAILEKRKKQKVNRTFSAYEVTVNRNTGKTVKRSKNPVDSILTSWRLSNQDYEVYRRLLNEQFKRYKKDYNERLRQKGKG